MRVELMRGLWMLVIVIASTAAAVYGQDSQRTSDKQLRSAYDKFIESLDAKRIVREYPKVAQQLDSSDPKQVVMALGTLAAAQDPDAIPLILPMLESKDQTVRVWAMVALEKIVSGHELRRRDFNHPSRIVIKPRQPNDRDLRPLAWLFRKVLSSNDESLESYVATMIGYVGLPEFEPELKKLVKSRHPATSNAAKYALEVLELGKFAPLASEELAAAQRTGRAFADLFRENNEDDLALLLVSQDALAEIIDAGVFERAGGEALYGKMTAANTKRFREYRTMFNDLSRATIVRVEPGRLGVSEFYAPGVRMLKNSYVTLAYANRVSIKLKIEEMVLVDGKCYIVEID
ncbi:MAG: HEAT repeat domain-containing protein [Pirellulaceae bacterium]|nr:HEAT repeat domain-containing protein [Pirellulaceae bacterium]